MTTERAGEVPTITGHVDDEGQVKFGEGTEETIREIVEGLAEQTRLVAFSMPAEDLRALLGRCLLFTAGPRMKQPMLEAVHITVSPEWAVGAAADGYTLGVQKIRCASESGGSFLMTAYDASHILRMLPKPNPKDPLGDVEMDFVAGAGSELPRIFNLRHAYHGRVLSYSCDGMDPAAFPDYQALMNFETDTESEAHFAANPEFLMRVAKAELAAKDQSPYIVRWYLLKSGQIAAWFTTEQDHDAFTALIMPMTVTWEEDRTPEAIAAFMRDLSTESQALRPMTEALPF